ncbi:lipopolysaccharide assembly protein LapA domain-containing protein [Oceanomicrobium pacificus]|uniref:DUF1049 domain-containing protein n=1 Tax=Oceanomicrobium pacificus TaxID=2692916 RepID=A0A6B0TZW6_9RHOB|nr:LapA family protein [Oceanomicrobium pacificus]MXU64431.1 DUF1049 domain-containing protein [Oceanomicrobium pacificus]
MRYLRIGLLVVVMLFVIFLAVANRGMVTLVLVPQALKSVFPYDVTLPLFLVILFSVLLGLILGYLLEWLREHKHRREASQRKREVKKLEKDIDGLKKKTGHEEDDVLALLN